MGCPLSGEELTGSGRQDGRHLLRQHVGIPSLLSEVIKKTFLCNPYEFLWAL
jgi:hypothetical protein